MAGEDGSVRIGTKIDESGLDKGLASVDKKLKSSSKGADAFAGSLAKAGLSGVAAAAALKTAASAVGNLTESYKAQYRAETQLEQAAKNNPYLTDLAVQQLKDYAGQMQQLAGVGDEVLIPLMAQLAGAGRTQAQIQEIIGVSLDWAATGSISLDSAVKNLNKTYGGLAGELGETIPELRSMTAEQLKHGGAVKLLGERYNGMAAEVTKNVGSADQLSNAFGDLKEQIGRPFEEGLAPARGFFAGIITGWTNSLAKLNEYRRAQKALHDDPENANAQLVVQKKLLSDIDKEYTGVTRLAYSESQAYGVVSKNLRDQIEELLEKREAQANIVATLEAQVRAEQKVAEAEKAGNAESAATASRDAQAAEYIAKATAAREKAVEQIRLKAIAEGEEADQLEIINAYVASYVSLISESNGLVSVNNSAARELLATIMQMGQEYDKYITSQEEDIKNKAELKEKADALRATMTEALNAIESADGRKLSERMRDDLEILDGLYKEVARNEQIQADELDKIWTEYSYKRKILAEQITATEIEEAKESARARKEKSIEALSIANDFATQYQNILTSIQQLATQTIENESKVKIAKLEEQYDKGAISAKEYEDKLEDIQKEAAKRKYEVDMWAWSSNLLSAISSTALGAAKALELGPIAGPVMAALMIAAGGANVSTILANKPIPPSFATGGIIGGTSYVGDNLIAKVNSGEMLLNSGQQRNLFDSINSGEFGAFSPKIQIFNSASNDVSARHEITEDGIRVMIDKTVSKSMADGRYNRSYRIMQNGYRGARYTN